MSHLNGRASRGVQDYATASLDDRERWVRWALRATASVHPLQLADGSPSRYARSFADWGERIPTTEAEVLAVRRKALRRERTLAAARQHAALVDDSANVTRQALRDAVKSRFGKRSYIEDFGDDWVIFSTWDESGDDEQLHKVGFTIDGGAVSLGDDVKRVERREVFVEVSKRERSSTDLPVERAFVLDVNGRTVVTAPVRIPELASHNERFNPQYLYLRGALVGAEEPNRNGAFWSTDDLARGERTVAHGPLNWLHDGRHIIGSITDSQLVTPAVELAAHNLPYIGVEAAVWRYLYPQEAEIIQRASDAGLAFLSMECVSKTVACRDHGCGEWPYREAVTGAAGVCDHVAKRTGARHFKEPTFLGAAAIVPPVEPGWANAHMEVMERAAAVAESAYEQAGRPDIRSDLWELIVGQAVQLVS